MHISDLQHIEITIETEVKGGFNFEYPGKFQPVGLNYQDFFDNTGYTIAYATAEKKTTDYSSPSW